MSFIGGMFGSNGSNFKAQSATLLHPLGEDAYGAQQGTLGELQNQQLLQNQLAAQNGIGNQNAVYQQYGNIASGQGPNPAAAMLAQQTGQNTANTAALMAGQRGASQNAGLIARQAGQQGAANQQNAVGQAATMQANQSLAALGQQANIAGSQVSNQLQGQQALQNSSQGYLGQMIGANLGINAQNIQNVSQQNQANAEIAKGNQAGQQSLLGGVTGGIGSALGLAHGGMVPHYAGGGGITDFSNMFSGQSAQPSGAGPQSAFGQSMAGGNPYSQMGQKIGSTLNTGIKSLAGSLFGKSGGVPAQGFGTDTDAWSKFANPNGGPAKNVMASDANNETGTAQTSTNAPNTFGNRFAQGGKVPAMVSPGEKYLAPNEVKKVAKGEKSAIAAGKTIHGKAHVHGDSLKNDTVPKTLTEGGIVLPRSITQSKTPGKDAQKFVEALLAKQGRKKAAA